MIDAGPYLIMQTKFPHHTSSCDRYVQITLDKRDDFWEIHARSQKIRDGRKIDAAWEDHLRCELHGARNSLSRKLDVEAFKLRATPPVDIEEAYTLMRKINIRHYAAMKASGNIYRSPDGRSVMGELRLHDEVRPCINHFYLHPVFMDAATIVPELFADQMSEPSGLHIPLYIESFQAVPHPQETCFVYVPQSENNHRSEGMVYYDLELYNIDGERVAFFKRFGVKEVRSKEMILQLEQMDDVPVTLPPRLPEVQIQNISTERALEEQLRTIIAAVLHKPAHEISLEMGFYDQGLDSGNLLELAQLLEKKLNTKLYPTLLFEHPTIKKLAAYLAEKQDVTSVLPVKKTEPAEGAHVDRLDQYYHRPYWKQSDAGETKGKQAQQGKKNDSFCPIRRRRRK